MVKTDKRRWGPKGSGQETKPDVNVNLAGGDHFATRSRANEFVRLMRSLPDPDPILKKMGKGITALRELMTDSHLESVWSVRCSTISGAEWYMAPGIEDGQREQEAAAAFAAALEALDVPRIIEEMMDAVAYGYSPLEVLWQGDGEKWGIGNIVGKLPEWFEFDQDNNLVFRTGVTSTEEIPENRFLLVRHRASYANPYGDKVFSKCFWPVTFKKNGFRWWTVFVEKYGGAFLYGKYPSNAGEDYKNELLGALERMVADAVAIVPEGAEITIDALSNKSTASNVHAEYIAMANAEISKAVLGQTLTTEIGTTGSYAAAMAHNMVRDDLAAADRRRVSAAFNRLAAVYTLYNFGSDVVPPRFEFVQDEDLQAERADRDTKLHQLGWRPKKEYIAREYGMSEDEFDLVEDGDSEDQLLDAAQSQLPHYSTHGPDCTCGCQTPPTVAEKIAALFSKEKREAVKDKKLMQDFARQMLGEGQAAINDSVKSYVSALGTIENYEDAQAALAGVLIKNDRTRHAAGVNEIRFAAQGIGRHHAKH